MGVHGTFCQLCGLPTQHDHYVMTGSGMMKIYRGAAPVATWEPDEKPFPFGPEHAWLKDAVVLPWDDARVLRGPIEDGALDDVLVFEGDDDGLAFHHACWELQGSPPDTDAAARALGMHAWAIVEAYHEQLFDFHGLAEDGRGWLLEEPKPGSRSRARIEAMLAVARVEPRDESKNVEDTLKNDRDWAGLDLRDANGRIGVIRGRDHAIKKIDKTGYPTLVRVTRFYEEPKLPGPEETAELEAFELALKAAVEQDAQAILVLVLLGHGRGEFLTWARDGAKTKAIIEAVPGASAASIEVRDDPNWQEAVREIQSRYS